MVHTFRVGLDSQCAEIIIGPSADSGVSGSHPGHCLSEGVSASRKLNFSEKSGVLSNCTCPRFVPV